MSEIVSETQSVTSHADGTEVQVEVIGPKGTPNFLRSLRAKGRALLSTGVLPNTVDAVKDVAVGDVQRLTKEIDKPPLREQRGNLREATLHTIVVNKEVNS